MAHETEALRITHPRVEAAPELPEALKAWRREASTLVESLPPAVYGDVEAFVLTDGAKEHPRGGRARAVALGELIRELPAGLRRRRSLIRCLLAYGIFRAAMGLGAREEPEGSGPLCRSAQGASHLAGAALESAHPRGLVLRALRLSCDDDFRKLCLRPKETWRSALAILYVLGTVTALGLWNLASPALAGAFGLGGWAKAWAANRLFLGLLEAGLVPLIVFRRNLSPGNRGLLAYLWSLVATHLADLPLGAAAGLGWLSVNLVGLTLVGLGGISVLQRRLQPPGEAPERRSP